MKDLRSFIGRHKGETAWLFGKGPSLSRFDFASAGKLRVAINDVIGHVPGCIYGFANDGVSRWAEFYKQGQILFQPTRCLVEYDSTKPSAIGCEVVTFKDDNDDELLTKPVDELCECLSIRRGTLGSAIQILHIMGVSEIVMVGIDGGHGHADGFTWRTELRHDHGQEYSMIRYSAINEARILGIKLSFFDQPDTVMTDGTSFVKFTRNIFVDGNAFCVGHIEAFPEAQSREIVSNGDAEHWTPPAKAEPETAAEHTKPENAKAKRK